MKKSMLCMTLVALLLTAVAVAANHYLAPIIDIDTRAIGNRLAAMGALSYVLFIATGALFTSVGLPRQLLAVIGGYAYGASIGVFIGTTAAATGAMITLFFARFFARPYVLRRFPEPVRVIDSFTTRNLFLKILLIRFLPFGTNLATNLAAGVLAIRWPTFLLASYLGYIPQMLIFALAGHGIKVGSNTQLAVAGFLFLASLLCGFYIHRQERPVRPPL